jgi:protein-L-isoaspartate(D-aspartate) O-methyltransferase
MSSDLTMQRRFFAEEVQAICNLRTAALVEALATVPREKFLRPGPWLIRSEADFGGPPRPTPDADPGRVYHNISIAIDPARQLFNGAPSVVSLCIDALGLKAGERVLQVGCGLGYYTALTAYCVGPSGRVVAMEIDAALASEARVNLASFGWVDVGQGDGTDTRGESFDAILVNAGMTHPHEAWLRALRPGGRLLLPLTCTMEQMGSTIGKGVILLISGTGESDGFDVRVVTMVAIYSAVGIRDASMNDRLGKAFMRNPWPPIKKLRRDPHEPSPSCWLHFDTFCFAAA